MKTDLYTKAVLTVIAVCLTISLLKEFQIIPTAQAAAPAVASAPLASATQSSGVVDVRIVDFTYPINVNLTHLGGHKFEPRISPSGNPTLSVTVID